ncbi:MAG: hypothetical protein AAF799_47155 [Myxococcota bacterium]
MAKRLSDAEMDSLTYHYTGNCFSCDRCSFFEPLRKGEPGAVEAYARYMKKHHDRDVEIIED